MKLVSHAVVTFGQTITLNLGNFESTRLEVSVSLPVKEDETIDQAFVRASAFVETHLQEQVNQALQVNTEPKKSDKPTRRKNL